MSKSLILLIIVSLLGLNFNISLASEDSVSEDKDGSYSLWLMPEGELLEKFTDLIIEISEEYDSPRYKPHVTLLGDLTGFTYEEALSNAKEIAENTEPFRITLTKVTYPTSYLNDHEAFYRSLYILAERTPPLMKANELARKLYNRENDPPFNPHLSIMYGPFPSETKEEIISKVGREFNISFEVKNIYLWSDKGLPKDWKRLKRVPIGNK